MATTTLTVADLDRQMERLNDERRAYWRARRMACDPVLVSAADAERIMRAHGAENVQGSTVCSHAKFRLWDLSDGQVYVLVHQHGHPCMVRYGNPVAVGAR